MTKIANYWHFMHADTFLSSLQHLTKYQDLSVETKILSFVNQYNRLQGSLTRIAIYSIILVYSPVISLKVIFRICKRIYLFYWCSLKYLNKSEFHNSFYSDLAVLSLWRFLQFTLLLSYLLANEIVFNSSFPLAWTVLFLLE